MNRALLREEIESELKELNEGGAGNLGTEEFQSSVNSVVKLMDKDIEYSKLEIEAESRRLDRESAERIKLREIEENSKDRTCQRYTDIAKWGGGILVFGAAYLVGLKFEETGSINSPNVRKAMDKVWRFFS